MGGFSIDTRTIAPGDFFIAIRGDRFDGHAYVAEAARKGAAGAMVSDDAVTADEALADVPLVVVDDTVTALQALARRVRRDSGAAVVAVTGSAGKSTTKEITAEFLSSRYSVYRNKGNLNNHIGLPLSLLELRRKPEIGVFELGMNHFGEISTLVGIAEPDVRVWTNVGPAHLEFFGSVEAIARAKAEIMEGAAATDVLVANADDDLVMQHAAEFRGQVRTFGVERPADVRAVGIRDLGIEGTIATVRTPAGEAELRTPLPGHANLSNVLAAAAVAVGFNVPLTDIVARAAALKPVARRGEVVRAGGVTIVDDSYNSNPRALSRALNLVAGDRRFARRVAVLGEMLELGDTSSDLHRAAGEEAARLGFDQVIAIGGPPARSLADGARSAGMAEGAVHFASSSAEAADLAAAIVRPGDVVLVKGSRGIRTEAVVERLKEAQS